MMTVNQVSKLTGVSIRTLHYYDKFGLLSPTKHTESGYRLYDDEALAKLQLIMFFRELEFPLKDIKDIVNSPDFDRNKALDQQIRLLEVKRSHLDELIRFAKSVKKNGGKNMDFTAFKRAEREEYARRAKAEWGTAPQYKEYEKKTADVTPQQEDNMVDEFMDIFAEFGKLRADGLPSESEEARTQVIKLQNYITANFYNCTNEILLGLGRMYAQGGEFTDSINSVGGSGTAEYVSDAINHYCLSNAGAV